MASIATFIAKWPQYRKAIGGFLGAAVPTVGGLISYGLISGTVAHDVGVILLACTPLFSYFGVAIAKPNAPKPT